MTFRAWAAHTAGGPLERFDYDPGPMADDEVEIQVEHCGICHSDLSMIDNEWGPSTYPLVPGHEAVGRVVALGPRALGLKVGQRVGVGWHTAQLHALPALHRRRPAPVRDAAADDRRPPWRLRRPAALALGLGGADSRRAGSRPRSGR